MASGTGLMGGEIGMEKGAWFMRTHYGIGFALAVSLLWPTLATAQAIGGTVTDTTGAVLPGVTVEARSPALIEQVRTAISDSSGQYLITALEPGTYSASFTLPGFSTVVRADVQLRSGFTATVNVQLRVGGVAETITVSGESPVVDVQTTRQTEVIQRALIDAVPTAKEWQNIVLLLPGVTSNRGADADVGGQQGQTFSNVAYHGSAFNDQKFFVDGFDIQGATARGTNNFSFMDENYAEYVVDTGGQTAETMVGGVSINFIPRTGSNVFSGSFYGNFSNTSLASDNMTDKLRATGLRDPNTVDVLWRASAGLGGPVLQDRLWFYLTATRQRNDSFQAGNYYNLTHGTMFYTPDFSRQAIDTFWASDITGRLTWQATPRNKITGYYDYNPTCHCVWIGIFGPTGSPDAARSMTTITHLTQATWVSPVSNRLLLDGGVQYWPQVSHRFGQPEGAGIPITDIGIPKQYNNPVSTTYHSEPGFVARASMSYVTGAHAARVGVYYNWHKMERTTADTRDGGLGYPPTNYVFLNRVPVAVQYRPTPFSIVDKAPAELSFFAQDQWRIDRLTLSVGARFDYLKIGYPAQTLAATPNIPVERFFPALQRAGFKDISPRFGLAYDLFGTAKTALKVSVNRYVGYGTANATNSSLSGPAVGNDTRSWIDTNGNFFPDGDPTNPAANGEIGPRTNGQFSRAAIPNRYDPDYIFGWQTRPSTNWEYAASVQHELLSRMSVNGGYFRRVFTSFEANVNAALTPGDFDSYCVTAPNDPRLPRGGGYPVCGLYDRKPRAVGLSDTFLTNMNNFGDQKDAWHGIDLKVDARPGAGLFLQGGLSTGKTSSNVCDITPNYPQISLGGTGTQVQLLGSLTGRTLAEQPADFCDQESAWLTQVKFLGSYLLPWDVQVSGSFQSFNGGQLSANAIYTSAQVAESLGRPLSEGRTTTVSLVPPGTMYGDRRYQVDVRLAKNVRVQGVRLQGQFDVYNVMNANTTTRYNTDYGTSGARWLFPESILPGRLVKFGVQMNF